MTNNDIITALQHKIAILETENAEQELTIQKLEDHNHTLQTENRKIKDTIKAFEWELIYERQTTPNTIDIITTLGNTTNKITNTLHNTLTKIHKHITQPNNKTT